MAPVAHVGHWAAELLYVAPVIAVVTWITGRALLEQRRARRAASAGPPPDRPA
jgi:hypothetical protein